MADAKIKGSAKYKLYCEIQDIVGNASLWPRNIRLWFWKGATYTQRPILVAFFYINGLNPELFMDWCAMSKMAKDESARAHYKHLFKSMEGGKHLQYLYGYNVTLGYYQTVSGKRHFY